MNPEYLPPVARIAGTGRAVPEGILTNADLEQMVETSDEWITTRTGIKTRHIVKPGTPLSDLAAEAGRKAIANAGMTPDQIDYLIIGTVTGDMKFPAAANFVQAKLGLVNAATFDIAAACSGFLYGLEIADSLIRGKKAKRVLVIGAEILTSMTNFEDRATCVLFGDGAGAAVVVPAEEEGGSGILSTYTGSNGELYHLLYGPGGGSLYPAKNRDLPSDMFTIKMAGNEVFKAAVKTMGDAALEALKRAQLSETDIDMLIPHQANLRIIDATAKRLKLNYDKVYINVERYGNTSAASIPIALDEANEKGLLKPGDIILCVAFGAGFTWGSVAVRW